MIRRKEECTVEYREHMMDGEGTIKLTSLISGDKELNDKGRLFNHMLIRPGCSIGYHVHDKDAELFYILKGTATYSDNGTIVTLQPGDVAICETGHGHSIANQGTEDLEFIALIVYA